MTHTIILLLLAVAVALTACEVVPIGTSAKLKKYQSAYYRSKHKKHRTHGTHRSAATQGMAVVSPEWLGEYRNLEAEHGDYTIPDDHRIQVDQTGKIKVPTSVIKHFHDLSKAPTEPTP
jgi:hypothetical protein